MEGMEGKHLFQFIHIDFFVIVKFMLFFVEIKL